jgi:hypothetical protein
MSRTPGQIAFESLNQSLDRQGLGLFEWKDCQYKLAWEAAANAVLEEAAKAMPNLKIPDNWATTEDFQEGWRHACIEAVEKLESLMCQAGASDAAPSDRGVAALQSDSGGEAKDWVNGTQWVHLKTGGAYTTVGRCRLEASGEPAVLYQGADGTVWARAMDEFLDGRFERLPASTQPPITEPPLGGDEGEEA